MKKIVKMRTAESFPFLAKTLEKAAWMVRPEPLPRRNPLLDGHNCLGFNNCLNFQRRQLFGIFRRFSDSTWGQGKKTCLENEKS